MLLAGRSVEQIAAGIALYRWAFSPGVDAVILSNPWSIAVANTHGTEWDRWLLTLAGVMRMGYRRPHADAVAIQHLMPTEDVCRDVREYGLNDAQLAVKYGLPLVAVEGRLASLGLGLPARRHLRLVVG